MSNVSKVTQNNAAEENQVAVQEIAGEMVAQEDIFTQVSPAIFENTHTTLFSSVIGDDRATKIKVYNAINSSENALGDHLGEILEITDMVAHAIELQDEVTGEMVQAMRVILLTKDGKAYHSVSGGVVGSLQKIIGIVGPAPWQPALKVIPVNVKTRKGFKTLTLQLQA